MIKYKTRNQIILRLSLVYKKQEYSFFNFVNTYVLTHTSIRPIHEWDANDVSHNHGFECPTYTEARLKAKNPQEWKDLDKPVWVDAEGEEKYDAVLDLFWKIGTWLRTAHREREG